MLIFKALNIYAVIFIVYFLSLRGDPPIKQSLCVLVFSLRQTHKVIFTHTFFIFTSCLKCHFCNKSAILPLYINSHFKIILI